MMDVWRRLRPMLALGGFAYRDAHYLVADMEVDGDAARRWVPAPLRLSDPPMASLFTAWFPSTTFGSTYREAGLFLHVQHGRKRAVFSPWMIVDDDVALIAGRELLGYPKKIGEISFTVDGDRVSAAASRRGTTLVRMEATLGPEVPDPPPMIGRPHRNVRGSLGLAAAWIIAFQPRESPLSVRRADIDVHVGGSERDPLNDLGFGRVRSAFLHRVDIGGSGLPVPVAVVSPWAFFRQLLLRVH